ncbi:MAG TPA: hypothetical protein VNM24_02590 [Burkholderiales bacterium]|jgi:hypothetical protein|nr:hypothetical protein [Burkholderiales bacterium]
MASKLEITYYASRDMLGMVSDEEYERFKDMLLDAFQEEWPDAQITIEDDEEAYVDLDGVSGDAEQDVRDRVEDIVNDVIDSGAWQDEEEDPYAEEEEFDEDEEDER